MGGSIATLQALIREYLFVSSFVLVRNRLRARTRAVWRRCSAPIKNIDELLEDLNVKFHRLRQSGIDEELFDVISGFEALSVEEK